jgi:hypothetical protein
MATKFLLNLSAETWSRQMLKVQPLSLRVVSGMAPDTGLIENVGLGLKLAGSRVAHRDDALIQSVNIAISRSVTTERSSVPKGASAIASLSPLPNSES